MDIALAITAIVVALALAILAACALARLIKTIIELRKVTIGLTDVLRWTVGRVSSQPSAPETGAEDGARDTRALDQM